MEESIQVFWRRALMPRQLYSEAVLSTGGRLHPLSPEGKGAWGKRWSSLCKGFLSPTRRTEGVVKTIERLDSKKLIIEKPFQCLFLQK